MKKDKLVYEAPEAEIFKVSIEGGMLMASGGAKNSPGLRGFGGTDPNDGGVDDDSDGWGN